MRHLSPFARAAALLGVLSLPACALHRPSLAASRLVSPGVVQGTTRAGRTSSGSITIESWDPRLAAALNSLSLRPTAGAYTRVGNEYVRLHVLDRAYEYFTQAIQLDPTDAAAFDARARIWRDWGFPRQGLDDALQAVTRAPLSAAAANTLGTVLEGAHEFTEAREWYERAAELDPGAVYALNNLCYLAIMQRQTDAIPLCTRAAAASPDSRAVRNNLALAYAANSQMEEARRVFGGPGTLAEAHYNMGILYLGSRRFDAAREAFHAALRLDPRMVRAAERARQAEMLDRKGGVHGSD